MTVTGAARMSEHEGSFTHANEEWRHDPERRAEWEERFARQADAVREAQEHIRLAVAAMRSGPYPQGGYGHEAIYARIYDAVLKADWIMHRDAEYITTPPNDNSVGNHAAFGRPGEH